MAERFQSFSFGKRDLRSTNNHWKELRLNNYKITKPVIICLGGNGTIDSTLANGFCKRAETMVGLKIADSNLYSTYRHIDVLGFVYGRDSEKQTAGSFNNDEISKIVDNLLMPLCIDNNGKLLPVEKTAKNFSLITFFTHCHGAKEVNNLMSNLNQKLEAKGYSSEDIKFIMSQSFQFSYSPLVSDNWLPTVRVDSFCDSFNYGLAKLYRDTYYHALNGVAVKHDKAGFFRKNPYPWTRQETISIFTSKLVNVPEGYNGTNVVDEHSIRYLERDENWAIGKNAFNAKNANVVSMMAGYSVARAVANSLENSTSEKLVPKIPLTSLAQELQSVLETYSQEELER